MEELFKELSEFVRKNRKVFKLTEQWLKEFDGNLDDAWNVAKNALIVDWRKIVLVVKRTLDEGVEFLLNTILSGSYTTREHPNIYLIRNALEEGRKAVANKKNNTDPFAIKAKDCSHNEDFTTVIWYGTEYSFNKTQARCIKYLWKNNSASENSIGEMLDSAACHGYRLRDTFRNRTGHHCAWGKMIISAGKGCFKLNKPQS